MDHVIMKACARAAKAGVQPASNQTMVLCVVLGCSRRSGRDKDVSFFRIPRIIQDKGEQLRVLSKRRRDGFLTAFSRVGLTEKILKNDRICSRHFISGNPADLLDETNPDWLPSLNLGHNKIRYSNVATGRWERRKARQVQADKQETAQTLLLQSATESAETTCAVTSQVTGTLSEEPAETITESPGTLLEESAEVTAEVSTQTVAYLKEDASTQTGGENLGDLKCRKEDEMIKITPQPFSEEAFQKDDYVRFYTGLPNFKVLKAIYNHVVSAVPTSKYNKLKPFEEFIAVLMKLRLNCRMQDLAYRFRVSISTISRIFLKWITVMDGRLRHLIVWPDRDCLIKTMPTCFQNSFGRKVVVVVDCFEVFIERPSSLHARACTWSAYKHHNTAKVLLGITPQGVISYVSEAWGGRVSDKYITEHCGILDHLIPGDVVLADRGFDISDSVGVMQAQLHIPAFTKGKSQLSALEVHQTRTIANVRIHVERVMGNVKQKYSMLQSTLPIHYIIKRNGNCPIIDNIVRVCCALCNVCESVVPFD